MALSYVEVYTGANLNAAKMAVTSERMVSAGYTPKVVFRTDTGAYVTEQRDGGYLSVYLVMPDSTQIKMYKRSSGDSAPVYMTFPDGVGTVVEVDDTATMWPYIKRAANANVYGINEDLSKVNISPCFYQAHCRSGNTSNACQLDDENAIKAGAWEYNSTYRRLVIPEDGLYKITASVNVEITSSTTNPTITCGIGISDTTKWPSGWLALQNRLVTPNQASNEGVSLAPIMAELKAGDYITLHAMHTAETLNISNNEMTYLLVEKVR